jgi:hypothetical protein
MTALKGTGKYVQIWITLIAMSGVLSYVAINSSVCSKPEIYLKPECIDACPKTRDFPPEEFLERVHQCAGCMKDITYIAYYVNLQCQTMALAPQAMAGGLGKIAVKLLKNLSGKEDSCTGTAADLRGLISRRKHEERKPIAEGTSFLQGFMKQVRFQYEAAGHQAGTETVLNWLHFQLMPKALGTTPATPTPTNVGYFWSVVYSMLLTIVLIVLVLILKWIFLFVLLICTGIMYSGGVRTIYNCSMPLPFIIWCFNVLCNGTLSAEDMMLDSNAVV